MYCNKEVFHLIGLICCRDMICLASKELRNMLIGVVWIVNKVVGVGLYFSVTVDLRWVSINPTYTLRLGGDTPPKHPSWEVEVALLWSLPSYLCLL